MVRGQASAAESRTCPGQGEPEGPEGTASPYSAGIKRISDILESLGTT